MNKKYGAWSRSRVVALALVGLAATVSFAQDWAFPSPMAPNSATTGFDNKEIKQIVSFIWDDNAYSGKSGSNYEGTKWKENPAFNTIGWVGGLRYEPGMRAVNSENTDQIFEGDYGMAWASKVLSGWTKENIIKYPHFNAAHLNGALTYGDTVVAWSNSANKLCTYVIIKEGWASAADISALAAKTIDEITVDANAQVCTQPWPGAEDVCKSFSELTDEQKRTYAKDNMVALVKVGEEGIVKGSPSKTNPDGSTISMTFNVISGQMIPAVSKQANLTGSYNNRQSKFGFWVPNSLYSADQFSAIAITWGREHPIYGQGWDGQKDKQLRTGYPVNTELLDYTGYLNASYQEAAELGHEIGNHTIDHLETNSPLPYKIGNPYPGAANATMPFSGTAYMDGFGSWEENGDYGGMDIEAVDVITMPDGEEISVDEAKQFAQTSGAPQQFMGWTSYIGKVLSKKGWKGLIDLGEDQIHDYLDISKQNNKVVAFRAPRLEVNSNMFWALSELGYLYDCGNEEGYEYNMNGTNYLWPYTMDNGSPNVAWQRMAGENMSNWQSLPTVSDGAIWQIPVAVLIVPEKHRDEIWETHKKIRQAENDAPSTEEETDWKRHGKITGFDFNLFILYGATEDIAFETMKYSIDQRINGGKAPMQIGCHTDYFTPIYDNATLNQAGNEAYKIALEANEYHNRIKAWERVVDYGTGSEIKEKVWFYNGKQTIDYVKSLVAKAKRGEDTKVLSSWEPFQYNEKAKAKTSISGNITNATVTTDLKGLPEADAWEQAGFTIEGAAGEFEFDHLSLTYNTDAPIYIRLKMKDDPLSDTYPYEVVLANLGRDVNSGNIPMTAFQRRDLIGIDDDAEIRDNNSGLHHLTTEDTKKIVSIEVCVQIPDGTAQTTKLSVKDFTLYSGNQTVQQVGVARTQKASAQKIAVLGMSGNAMRLNLAQKGLYNIDVVTVNGRIVKSFRNMNLNVGINTLPLNKLSAGMYMIRIRNKQINTTLKSLVM